MLRFLSSSGARVGAAVVIATGFGWFSLSNGRIVTPVAMAAGSTVTFTKDVAPIFREKCETCHHPGTVAPMSLTTYEESRPWARSIKDRVIRREMPPWHLDKTVGIQKFKNYISLTDQQISTIVAWVDGGAVMGDPKDLPAPQSFADDEWTIGKPDLIVSLPKEDIVNAKGPDWWVDRIVEAGITHSDNLVNQEAIEFHGHR